MAALWNTARAPERSMRPARPARWLMSVAIKGTGDLPGADRLTPVTSWADDSCSAALPPRRPVAPVTNQFVTVIPLQPALSYDVGEKVAKVLYAEPLLIALRLIAETISDLVTA